MKRVPTSKSKPVKSPDADKRDHFRIDDLCAQLEKRFSPQQIVDVRRAYQMAANAHEGQTRKSGEAYIFHPLAVARTIADLHMDCDSIMAAILHDVIEDTAITRNDLEKEFGPEVAALVDGLSKLTHLKFESQVEAQAANFRKMFLAMVDDIRVVLIKLADRLHNVRTLGVLAPLKRRRIARETLEIYAPIANRLGIHTLKLELEDLGFASLYPMRYRTLTEAVKRSRSRRKESLQKSEIFISAKLEEAGFNARVRSREKHLYSIYQKMHHKRLSFNEVFDKLAIRVVVTSVDDCYRVLGVMHNLYKPVPGRFKDYIAIPKSNGYQSLHTNLFGRDGVPIEVQIRTEEMDRFAESGVAAHWLYKSGKDAENAQVRAREWLRDLLDLQQRTGSSIEFLENVKVNLFPDEIYVFSPAGDIYELPARATVVDFAYAIHSDIGHTCSAAKVDRRLVPMNTTLQTGQTVEVITSPGSRPSPLWLNFVVTAKARTAIRHFLKNMQEDEAQSFGERLLKRALTKYSMTLDQVRPELLQQLLDEFHYAHIEQLWIDIGLGNRVAALMAKRLIPEWRSQRADSNTAKLPIKGTEGMVISFAKCCRPIPGDGIQGFLSAGRGLVIHRSSCSNTRAYGRTADKWIQVEWDTAIKGEYPVVVATEVIDKRGVLAMIASIISELDSNIENINFKDRDGRNTYIDFTVSVRDRKHLAEIIRNLRNRALVIRVRRLSQ